jgi:two-component system phosphate regulon response regulator PhoB
VLVVEDDTTLARIMKTGLERGGLAVVAVHSGEEALDWLAAEVPDIVLLDVVLPGIDGFTVLRHLRAERSTAHVPVIMVTGRSDEDSIFRGWAEGVHSYVTKPFDPSELRLLVTRTLAAEQD